MHKNVIIYMKWTTSLKVTNNQKATEEEMGNLNVFVFIEEIGLKVIIFH